MFMQIWVFGGHKLKSCEQSYLETLFDKMDMSVPDWETSKIPIKSEKFVGVQFHFQKGHAKKSILLKFHQNICFLMILQLYAHFVFC